MSSTITERIDKNHHIDRFMMLVFSPTHIRKPLMYMAQTFITLKTHSYIIKYSNLTFSLFK